MSTTQETARKASVWNGRINLNFRIRGQGPTLVYFHPAAGFAWDPFLEKLSESYTVYAPEFPGTTLGDPHAIHQVDDLADAVFIYEEAIRAIGIRGAVAVGQSFGGMLAIELAAAFPEIFSKLIVMTGFAGAGASALAWGAAGGAGAGGVAVVSGSGASTA